MKILVADDDSVSRRVLEATLAKWGYEVLVVTDGPEAWQRLRSRETSGLAILDWMMPGMDGLEICRKVRASLPSLPIYLILLTGRDSQVDLVRGLEAGADDYMTKPFDPGELRARIRVAQRVIDLQRSLAARVSELEDALQRVKQLQGLLPICSYCKKIRDDRNYWEQVDTYLARHTQAEFTHGICPDCYENVVKPMLEKMQRESDKASG